MDIERQIVENNYSVQRLFDDMPDGAAGQRHLSKDEAENLLKSLKEKQKRNGHLTRFEIKKDLAIIAVVPFNNGVAYVFNREFTECNKGESKKVTCGIFEDLMSCYVYSTREMPTKLLNKLVEEYEERGGTKYFDYRSFENTVLKEIRKERRIVYQEDIINNYILRHGFKKENEGVWINGNKKIVQLEISHGSIHYPSTPTHLDIKAGKKKQILIGSIFGRHYDYINQLEEKKFCIACKESQRESYKHAFFSISWNKKN